jgi:hypothetical protein
MLIFTSCKEKPTFSNEYTSTPYTSEYENKTSQEFDIYDVVTVAGNIYVVYSYDSHDDTYKLKPITYAGEYSTFIINSKYVKEYKLTITK